MTTREKNISRLVEDALSIEAEEAKEAGALGFMARALVQATMPHSRVNGSQFQRKNGAFKLTMMAPEDIGLPYGNIPRLYMTWISTEVVKTRERELILGHSLSGFLADLGLIPSGGRWGTIARFKEQSKKLFSCAISCTYDDGKSFAIQNVQPVVQANLWWSPKNPNQSSLFESSLKLGEEFYNEVINNPIPIDMRVIKALKRSPMALDIYSWLTYRMSYLKRPTEIPWAALQVQFGSDYAQNPHGVRNFKQAFLRELKKVHGFYKTAKAAEGKVGLILQPSPTHIPFEEKTSLPENPTLKAGKPTLEDIKAQLRNLYLQYCRSRLVEIIENEIDEEDKKLLLSGFRDYILRNKVKNLSGYNLQDNLTQEWLHRYIDNHWHELLTKVKSFEEFSLEELVTP